MDKIIKAPFTLEQVNSLKKKTLDKYCCPKCDRKLQPHFLGLMCYKHGIIQDWVWEEE